jgi:hypothetical protein
MGVLTINGGFGKYQTDIFEKNEYKINDFLYCSENGKISNEDRYIGNIIIGVVNFVSNDKIGFVVCFARNLEEQFCKKDPANKISKLQFMKDKRL